MKLKRVSIAIEDDLWTKIIAVATTQDRSTSQYVRLVLREHVKSLGIKVKKRKG